MGSPSPIACTEFSHLCLPLLDAKNIGPLVSRYAITFLLATPTFLQLYMRGCSAEDFGSLRLVMTGAEKLPERLAARTSAS